MLRIEAVQSINHFCLEAADSQEKQRCDQAIYIAQYYSAAAFFQYVRKVATSRNRQLRVPALTASFQSFYILSLVSAKEPLVIYSQDFSV
jgi:hypothetical protein